MDIMEYVKKAVEALTADNGLLTSFTKDPVGIIKKIIGTELPMDSITKIIEAVKKQLTSSGVLSEALGNMVSQAMGSVNSTADAASDAADSAKKAAGGLGSKISSLFKKFF